MSVQPDPVSMARELVIDALADKVLSDLRVVRAMEAVLAEQIRQTWVCYRAHRRQGTQAAEEADWMALWSLLKVRKAARVARRETDR